MNSEIRTTTRFRKEANRLSRKYSSLKYDLFILLNTLFQNPTTGIPLGKNFYKIRLQIASKGKGKSGGARVITHVTVTFLKDKAQSSIVYLATIYDKAEMSTISDKE